MVEQRLTFPSLLHSCPLLGLLKSAEVIYCFRFSLAKDYSR